MEPGNLCSALTEHPRFQELIERAVKDAVEEITNVKVEEKVGSCTIYLAIPHVRTLCNRLLLILEDAYRYTPSTGGGPAQAGPLLPASPAERGGRLGIVHALTQRQPHLGALLQQSLDRFAIGTHASGAGRVDGSSGELCDGAMQLRASATGSSAPTPDNRSLLPLMIRDSLTMDEHLIAPEDILRRIHGWQDDISLPALHEREPFLHAVLVGADDLVRTFLAEPRMVTLAHAALQTCKQRLDPTSAAGSPIRQHPSWTWQQPEDPAKVQHFISQLLLAVPSLGESAADFAACADALAEAAHRFRRVWPTAYEPAELQHRAARCAQLGMFDEAVRSRCPFASNILVNLDTVLSLEV